MANGQDLGFVPAKKADDLGFVPSQKKPAIPPNTATSIGPDNRGILSRVNDWWTSKPDYEGTLAARGRSPREKAADLGTGVAVGSLPLLGLGAVTAPAATTLGLGGGIAGGVGGRYLGKEIGEPLGAPELGEDILGTGGALLGGYAGGRAARPILNKTASLLRNPATPSQAQMGQPGTVKDIMPPQLQRWTLPPWLVPKGELGTPTNPGPFSRIPARLTKAQIATQPDPVTGAPKPPTPSRLDISQVPEPVQRFPTENPGYMASVPRRQLLGLASSQKLGAGEQLQQLGQRVLYTPREGIGYPEPRERIPLGGGGEPSPPLQGKPLPFTGPPTRMPAYQPMSPAEIATLSQEAGRPLTEQEAQQFLLRKTQTGAVANMLRRP